MAATKEMEEAKPALLIVRREAEMLSCAAKRMGWFMDPGGTPYVPSRHKAASFEATRSASVEFRGWVSVPRHWSDWVEKLRPHYVDTWKKAGIFPAIISTKYRIIKDQAVILGVARYWCDETSSFIFPWGEATVTLEDVAILGSFSVIGEPVRGVLGGRLKEMELKMEKQRKSFNKCRSKKPAHYLWISHFMQGGADQQEHIAFLTLWLSRFVFPKKPFDTISANLIPLAIRLSLGERIALAPAILASLYRDLRSIKDHLNDDSTEKESPLAVYAPFNLLQLWLWVRFKALEPKERHNARNDDPISALWHDMRTKIEPCALELILKSYEEFKWQPYSYSVNGIVFTYEYNGTKTLRVDTYDTEIRSFGQFLKSSYLVGLDCIEKYLPHRVAKQLGLDQDVPGNIPSCGSDWKSAWRSYDNCSGDVEYYIPPHLHQPDVTQRYSLWWKQNMLGFGCSQEKGIAAEKSSSKKIIESGNIAVEKEKSLGCLKKEPFEETVDNIKLSELVARVEQSPHNEHDSVRFLEKDKLKRSEVQKQFSLKRKSSGVQLPIRHEKKVTLDSNKLLMSKEEHARENLLEEETSNLVSAAKEISGDSTFRGKFMEEAKLVSAAKEISGQSTFHGIEDARKKYVITERDNKGQTTVENGTRKAAESQIRSSKEKKACDKGVTLEQHKLSSRTEKWELQKQNKTDKENNDCVNYADKQIEHNKKTPFTKFGEYDSIGKKNASVGGNDKAENSYIQIQSSEGNGKEEITGQEDNSPGTEELEHCVNNENQINNGCAMLTMDQDVREVENNLGKVAEVENNLGKVAEVENNLGMVAEVANNDNGKTVKHQSRKDTEPSALDSSVNTELNHQPELSGSEPNLLGKNKAPQAYEEVDMEIKQLLEETAAMKARIRFLEDQLRSNQE